MERENINQAAIKYLEERGLSWDVKDLELVIGAFNYIQSHQWISVEDELPKPEDTTRIELYGSADYSKPVLVRKVFSCYRGERKLMHVDYDVTFYNHRDKEWHLWGNDVTHWMPIQDINEEDNR